MKTITGNTYPHRAALRAMGAQWDRRFKRWLIEDAKHADAQALVHGNMPAYDEDERGDEADELRRALRADADPRNVSRVTRFSSGAVVYQNKKGRCEDAPCCGCCS